jgi:hypothetical protein
VVNQPYTRDDFTEAQWDDLCRARLHYVRGTNKATWWRVLRAYTSFRTSSPIGPHMATIVDRYLIDHPSWVRHQEGK